MPIDIITENPNPFFDPTRISRAIFDPRKNFLKTIWQKTKPILDSELNEREDIDNFIRRQILVLLAGEICIVEGIHPQQSVLGNKVYLSEGEMAVRGWDIIVEKNEGGFPTVDQNFNVFDIDTSGAVPQEDKFPASGMGFSPNLTFDQPVGDNTTTILVRNTGYNALRRELTVELENTCSLSPITYRVETLDGFYSETATIAPHSTHVFTLRESLVNVVSLSPAPSIGSGSRPDFIYLQIGEVEICPTVVEVRRNGHISHPETVPTMMLDPVYGAETTRRTQVQFNLRASAGDPPIAPKGFWIYPLFRVMRLPGQPIIKLDAIEKLVPMIDLRKSGLFELLVEGTGITHDTLIQVADDNTLTPSTVTRVVGSTINILNCGPANARRYTFDDETFTLQVGESKAINFDKIGTFHLFDATLGTDLGSVHIIGWGGGGADSTEIGTLRCAVGEQYFETHGPFVVHPCDDSSSPVIGTEQSLDRRMDSMILDMFEMAVCLTRAQGTSALQLSYLFVDRFKDLLSLSPASRTAIQGAGIWSPTDGISL